MAFALGRTLGPAVIRNRLRRRLRVLCRELDAAGQLPPGMLLLGATPTALELTFEQLRQQLRTLLSDLSGLPRRPAPATETSSVASSRVGSAP